MTRERGDTAAHFSRQAGAYAESSTHAAGEDLEIVHSLARPRPGDRCLDVATGAGHTALRIAPDALLVLGLDLAPGMVEKGRALAAERQVRNALFLTGDAQALPFAAESFELVTCRIAPHHFADVDGAVREVARVLVPGGRFVLEDSVAPEDPDPAAFLHDLEVRRDPTHVRTLSQAEWRRTLAGAGLRIVEEHRYSKTRPFREWCRRSGMSEPETSALAAWVLSVPERVRGAFFDVQDGEVVRFTDDKLIVRADRE